MTIGVSYMGTKKRLVKELAPEINKLGPGPFLDLFSGIGAISDAIEPPRPVWSNDAQLFSASVAKSFYTASEPPWSQDRLVATIFPHYQKNKNDLAQRFHNELHQERTSVAQRDITALAALNAQLAVIDRQSCIISELENLREHPERTPYRQFTLVYAGTYIALEQAIDIDSLRFGINRSRNLGEINDDQYRWCEVALCQALAKVATTTGHFAQYIELKQKNSVKFLSQRTRSVCREWLNALQTFTPKGGRLWRQKNRVYNYDALELLTQLQSEGNSPTIVFADPPYTRDQYSRYYHLYETLIHYDYPACSSKAKYRPDRFSSVFCYKTEVRRAMESLIHKTATLGSTLILTYPVNGLLENSEDFISSAIVSAYGRRSFRKIGYRSSHSSMGALTSAGLSTKDATEVVYIGNAHYV